MLSDDLMRYVEQKRFLRSYIIGSIGIYQQEEEKDTTMSPKKKNGELAQYMVYDAYQGNYGTFETYEEAEETAKRSVGPNMAGGRNFPIYIFKAEAVVKAPMPEAEVTKLT